MAIACLWPFKETGVCLRQTPVKCANLYSYSLSVSYGRESRKRLPFPYIQALPFTYQESLLMPPPGDLMMTWRMVILSPVRVFSSTMVPW